MSMTGTASRQQDITGGFNMYHEAELTDLRKNIADVIVNALFMEPGNLPSMPNVGVNIQQYFYTEITEATASQVESDLTRACGYLPGGASIKNIIFDCTETKDGQPVFVLAIRLGFGEEDTILGISMIEEQHSDLVRFNFEYID